MAARFIAIEGIDGVGKGTQAWLLRARFQAQGNATALFSFPRYEQTRFGRWIGDYLNGRFGPLESVDPFLAAQLFAGDRFETKPEFLAALAGNEIVICDRYVASNIAHQAARVPIARREELIRRIEELEYSIYALPRPETTIFLDAKVTTAKALIARKSPRAYTDRPEDLHEADATYLDEVCRLYREICAAQDGWIRVPIEEGGQIRPIGEIAEEVWQACANRKEDE